MRKIQGGDRKMTKDEIKKGLKCCEMDWCVSCPYFECIGCEVCLKQDALNLIIEQDKEIERLKEEVKQAQIDVLNKLRRRAWQGYQIGMYIVSTQEIDELIKEVQK